MKRFFLFVVFSFVILTFIGCQATRVSLLMRSYVPGVEKVTTKGNEIFTWETATAPEGSTVIASDSVYELSYRDFNKDKNIVYVDLRQYQRNGSIINENPINIWSYECYISDENVYKINGVVFQITEVTPILIKAVILKEPEDFVGRKVFKNYEQYVKKINNLKSVEIASATYLPKNKEQKSKELMGNINSDMTPPYIPPTEVKTTNGN